MTWEDALSAAEQDAIRVAMLKKLLPLSREALSAGLKVRRNPRFGWETDEKRLQAEFEAVLVAQLTNTG